MNLRRPAVLLFAGALLLPADVPAAAAPRQAIPAPIIESLVNAGAPPSIGSALAEPSYEIRSVAAAGDLDGDGRRDAIRVVNRTDFGEIGGGVPTLIVEGARGRDGARLWRRELPGTIGWAMPALVGPQAKAGIIITAYRPTVVPAPAYAGSWVAEISAHAGTSATPVWTRTVGSGGFLVLPLGFFPLAWAAAEYPVFSGLADAGAGRAHDALFSMVTAAGVAFVGDAGARRPQVVSGADGTLLDQTGNLIWPRTYTPSWIGDVSGDGLADYVAQLESAPSPPSTVPAPRPAKLEFRRGYDGALLWSTNEGLGKPSNLGDLTGDRSAEIGIGVFGGGTVVLDGKTGTVLRRSPVRLRKAGDVNHDGRHEVFEIEDVPFTKSSSPAGMRVHLRTGKGALIASTPYLWRSFSGGRSAIDIGDVDGDGFDDAGFSITYQSQIGSVQVETIVSGRTTRPIRFGEMLLPLRASVDGGRGHDLYRGGGGRGPITVYDGLTGRRIWRGPDFLASFESIHAADLTGDGRSEVIVHTSGRGYVLRGSDGKVLWRA